METVITIVNYDHNTFIVQATKSIINYLSTLFLCYLKIASLRLVNTLASKSFNESPLLVITTYVLHGRLYKRYLIFIQMIELGNTADKKVFKSF